MVIKKSPSATCLTGSKNCVTICFMNDIRYLAGLFDGEGTLGVYKQKTTGYRRTAGITNTYMPVLEAFRSRFGGNIYPQRKATTTHKATWGWELQNGPEIMLFLYKIRPHLTIKAEQVDVMLTYLEGNLDKDTAVSQLKELKHQGKLKVAISTL